MVGEVAVADHCADDDAAVGVVVDFDEVEVGDVDQGGGLLDAVLHQVDEIGASAEEFGVLGGDGVEGFVGCGGALIGEGVHAVPPVLVTGDSGGDCGGSDGGDDVGVGSAAADVAGHALADLVVGEGGHGGRGRSARRRC